MSGALDNNEAEAMAQREEVIERERAKDGEVIVELDCRDISPNRFQNRKKFDLEELEELREQIKQNGQAQPIGVRKRGDRYEIIFGERRWLAVGGIEGLKIKAIIRELSDLEMIYQCGTENAGRAKIHDYEKWLTIEMLLAEKESDEVIRTRLGHKYPDYQKIIRFGKLPLEVRQLLDVEPAILGRNEAQSLTTEFERLSPEQYQDALKLLLQLMNDFVAGKITRRSDITERVKASFNPPKTRNRQKENKEHDVFFGEEKIGSYTTNSKEVRLVLDKERLPKDDFDKIMSIIHGLVSIKPVEEKEPTDGSVKKETEAA
ncbi:ParB/RepB/Spo0J family partition protein [Pseudomonas aeruginosa]